MTKPKFSFRFLPWTALLCVAVCFLQLLGVSYCNTDSWNQLFATPLATGLQLLVGSAVLYLVVQQLFTWLEAPRRPAAPAVRHAWLLAAGIMLVCWLPSLALNYPGTFGVDAVNQLDGWYGATSFIDDNRFNTLLMAGPLAIGKALGSSRFGLFLYTLLQSLACAAVFARICVLCGRFVGHRAAYWGSLAFFALTPFWGAYMQWIGKDVLYTAMLAAWLCEVCVCLRQRSAPGWKTLAALVVCGVLASLLRLNGIYTVLPTLLLLVPAMPKGQRRKAVAVLLLTVVLFSGANNVLKPDLTGTPEGTEVYLLGLVQWNQAQMVMRCVVEHGEALSAEEIAVIDAVLVYKDIPKLYNPTSTDDVLLLRRYTTTQALADFSSLWRTLLLRWPASCVQAFLNQCYGYFSAATIGYANLYDSDVAPAEAVGDFTKPVDVVTRRAYTNFSNTARTLWPVRYLAMAGLYSFITLLCAWALLRKKQWAALVPVVPAALNIAICVVGPLAGVLRYALPTAAAAPLLLCWVAATLRPVAQTGEQ